jgi:hypothetical protein
MSDRLHPGVTFYEDDRQRGPFMIRIGGTSEFVSSIRDGYYSRWGSPGEGVTLVEGWENPKAMTFKTMDDALEAADKVWGIEGFHTSIEATNFENR